MKRKLYDVPKVIGDRILVEVELDSDKDVGLKSSIIQIVDSTKDRYLLSANVGTVLQIGSNAVDESIIEDANVELEPGHIIKFLSSAGVTYKNNEDDPRTFRIIRRGDIMAVIGEIEDE